MQVNISYFGKVDKLVLDITYFDYIQTIYSFISREIQYFKLFIYNILLFLYISIIFFLSLLLIKKKSLLAQRLGIHKGYLILKFYE